MLGGGDFLKYSRQSGAELRTARKRLSRMKERMLTFTTMGGLHDNRKKLISGALT